MNLLIIEEIAMKSNKTLNYKVKIFNIITNN